MMKLQISKFQTFKKCKSIANSNILQIIVNNFRDYPGGTK